MQTGIRKGNRPFKDPVKFPRGFGRTGDFSISAADLLTEFGDTLLQLESGTLIPETLEEQDFLLVIRGEKEPETALEKTWCKYVQIARGRKRFYVLNGARKSTGDVSNDDYYHDDYDLGIA